MAPRPTAPAVELEGVDGPAVVTAVRIVQPSARGRAERSASCLERGRGRRPRPKGSSVERIGVYSETVTFEESSGRAIFGCDNSPGPREENRRWCGGAYGQLYGGRLRDPRLDIGGCRTDEDEPIAFVWVELGENTRFLAVRATRLRRGLRNGGKSSDSDCNDERLHFGPARSDDRRDRARRRRKSAPQSADRRGPSRLGHWEGEGEDRTLAGRGLNRQRSAVGLGDRPRHREPDPPPRSLTIEPHT